jgi:hypothetical protein
MSAVVASAAVFSAVRRVIAERIEFSSPLLAQYRRGRSCSSSTMAKHYTNMLGRA